MAGKFTHNPTTDTYNSITSDSLDCSIYDKECNFPTLYLAGGQEMVPIVGSNPSRPEFHEDEGLFRVWKGEDCNYTADKFVEANAGKKIDTMLKPLLKRYCKFIKIGRVDRDTMIEQINFCIQIAKDKCLGSIDLATITEMFIEISNTLMFSKEKIAKEMGNLIKGLRYCDSPVHVANFLEEREAQKIATDVAMSGLDLD